MKTAVIPQVRIEPGLRADLDSVLLPGETLAEFVEESVRRAVEFTPEADADLDRLFDFLLDQAETVDPAWGRTTRTPKRALPAMTGKRPTAHATLASWLAA